jgi:ABC-2 type transport system ATP-binding protein
VALLGSPDLLVLDEPTVGLDPVLREELWGVFHRIAEAGSVVLVSSHVMDEADRCDRLLLMRDGEIIADGSPADIRESTGAGDIEHAFLALVRGRPLREEAS